MRSGALRYAITIQRSTVTLNDAGTPTAAWTDLAEMRAERVQQSTEEFLRSGATDETAIVFRTRHLDGVTTADRILFEGRVYNIREIVPIERRRGLELRAVAIEGAA